MWWYANVVAHKTRFWGYKFCTALVLKQGPGYDNPMDKNQLGHVFEEQAVQYLELIQGWRVLARNVNFREGEIDLIMEAATGELRFVEVKGRLSNKFGDVVESLTAQKVRRIKKAMWKWRQVSGDRRVGELWFIGWDSLRLDFLRIE